MQLENDGFCIRSIDGCNIVPQYGAKPHIRIFDLDIYGRFDVRRGEFYTVTPENAFAEFDAHFGKVGIVDRLVGSQRIIPGAIDAFLRIDVPKGIKGGLLQSIGLAAGIDSPDIKPAGIFDCAFGVFEYQEFFTGNILWNSLCFNVFRKKGDKR